jgi:hypothetical protein
MNHSNPHFTGRQRSAYELGTLLRNLPNTVDLTAVDKRQQLEAAEKHAENYSEVLLDGLESLGRVMWSAAENEDWPVSQRDIGRLGTMISQLAIQLQFLENFRAEAGHDLAEVDKKGARK